MEGGEKEEGKKERKQGNKGMRKERIYKEFTFILSSEPGKNVLAMKDQESEAQAGV